MIFYRNVKLKYRYENMYFWCQGYYIDKEGKIKKQLQGDIVTKQTFKNILENRIFCLWFFELNNSLAKNINWYTYRIFYP